MELFFQPTCSTPLSLEDFVFLFKHSGRFCRRAARVLQRGLSSLVEDKQRGNGKLLSSSCQGRLYSVSSRKATSFMQGISWIPGGQWLPAVVCFRNVSLQFGLMVWGCPSTQPHLMHLYKKKKKRNNNKKKQQQIKTGLSNVSCHGLATFGAIRKSFFKKKKRAVAIGEKLKEVLSFSRRTNSDKSFTRKIPFLSCSG